MAYLMPVQALLSCWGQHEDKQQAIFVYLAHRDIVNRMINHKTIVHQRERAVSAPDVEILHEDWAEAGYYGRRRAMQAIADLCGGRKETRQTHAAIERQSNYTARTLLVPNAARKRHTPRAEEAGGKAHVYASDASWSSNQPKNAWTQTPCGWKARPTKG
ncbi:hypothetical protein K488DRAFT_67314 [Vararia minispora EC-137]|uniref:Uncharacterized protein n=1 Tax=Vararia minispora EC-137 TaxID=1314806 RepID=A0ACB8QZH5_9AGAM|nr:hypothetical protein K488DRAFT_67314 [Vararia minispora EC-137]